VKKNCKDNNDSGKINDSNNLNNNIDPKPLYQQLLTAWSLSENIPMFKKKGFDNVEIWDELLKKNSITLSKAINMQTGHVIQFTNNYRVYQTQNTSSSEPYKKLLKEWSLPEYIESFENAGFENVNFWGELFKNNCKILKKNINMRYGHILEFTKHYQTMLLQNGSNNIKNNKMTANNETMPAKNENSHSLAKQQERNDYNYYKQLTNQLNKEDEFLFEKNNDQKNDDNICNDNENNNTMKNVTMEQCDYMTMGDFLPDKKHKNINCDYFTWKRKKPTGTKSFATFIHPKHLNWSCVTDTNALKSFKASLKSSNYVNIFNKKLTANEISNILTLLNNSIAELHKNHPQKEYDILQFHDRLNMAVEYITGLHITLERISLTNTVRTCSDDDFENVHYPDHVCNIYCKKRLLVDYKPERSFLSFGQDINTICDALNQKMKNLKKLPIDSKEMNGQYWHFCLLQSASYAIWCGCDYSMLTDGNMSLLMHLVPENRTSNISKINIYLYPIFGFDFQQKYIHSIDLSNKCSFIEEKLKLCGNLFYFINQEQNTFEKSLFQREYLVPITKLLKNKKRRFDEFIDDEYSPNRKRQNKNMECIHI